MKIIDEKGKIQPDPFVIKANEKYYLYCTGVEGVDLYSCDSLDGDWKYHGICFKVDGNKEYWAPCVIATGGKYYMYVSFIPKDETDVHQQAIKVAVSDNAEGPFAYVKNLLPPFSIDAHVVENGTGLYIFYSVNNYETERAGTYIVVDKMFDPLTVCGKPKTVVVPMLDEEIFEKDRFKKGQHWHTIEGACYVKDKGVHYCLYSANSFLKPTYHIGYVLSKDKSDVLNEIDYVRPYESYHPLICSDEKEQSTGHNSVIDHNGENYVVYHGRDIDSSYTADDRTARICKLRSRCGKLKVEKL